MDDDMKRVVEEQMELSERHLRPTQPADAGRVRELRRQLHGSAVLPPAADPPLGAIPDARDIACGAAALAESLFSGQELTPSERGVRRGLKKLAKKLARGS